MKLEFFKRPASEQALIIRETAARRPFLAVLYHSKAFTLPFIAHLLRSAAGTTARLILLVGNNHLPLRRDKPPRRGSNRFNSPRST